jgi:hypothetical protein
MGLAAAALALALFPLNASADAICALATCPGAPLPGVGPFPAPVSVAEGQNFILSEPVITGDVNLLEADGSISDVLRFSAGGAVLLYSDDPGTEPSDLGIPVNIPPIFSMSETADTALGAPIYTAGMAGDQNVYYVLSDVNPAPDVPELETWAMMLVGFAGLGLVWRRRARIGATMAA